MRKLKIGYVSADFRHHSAVKVFGYMLTEFNGEAFEVYAYSNNKLEDEVTALLKERTIWRPIAGISDEVFAQMIRDDKIDILVDLSGHSAGNRLLGFARKPAPIQITAWGYATGTGMSAIDYFFADPVAVPEEARKYFAEEVVYLPCIVSSFFPHPFPDIKPSPSLTNGYFTFGSFNRLAKITERTYGAWVEILKAVPTSHLFMKTAELTEKATRDNILKRFTDAGISPERVTFEGGTSWRDHMEAYNKIDLSLDPFPHGGGVSTMESLMMGVPVLTLRWPTTVGRLSSAILTAVRHPECITETVEDYIAWAVRLATFCHLAASVRGNTLLRSHFLYSIVGDNKAYTHQVEWVYQKLWRRYEESQA